ncbi:uncharacterized protein Z518_02462 [Rhinocladiella mackenziei CBS 650.93]|uniref:Rhinocladiella mackenziei CBS 650.93 unplaced genomic scaffold supercont1.2, whole genome shotgun sequence n=1 Tax=Rhinocladiella mackenziei CBS 650.93 TaxID=1442369 RepID=A0A0D2HBK1_9EURO|nr:uncharacterized protein Z518_02462 [Rhinocladiella mackenziei CBS 650.93]KIX07808.1 hypothetical protein Z518_02462 [Rhinocladiella mackenziei CBS 650.93]
MDEKPRSHEEAEGHIKRIRRNRGFVDDGEANFTNVNREDLEASISILAEGLYEKSTHFLLELIQNADDCSYDIQTPKLLIRYWNGRLRIDYNEVGFTRRDVEALCRVGRSTKSNSGNQIGEKGIGFKSVFKIADVVSISSGYYSFKFDRTTTNLGMITPQWDTFPAEPLPGFTSVMLQLRDGYDQTELLNEMRSMDPRYLLFLRKLKEIYIAISHPDRPEWETTLRRRDDQASDESRRTTTLSHDDQSMTYLVRQYIASSLPYEPKRGGRKKSSILLAFPYTNTQRDKLESQQVYAFLPIRDYGFNGSIWHYGFLIHADFLLTANRGDIDSSSQWNTALREAILDAFMEDARHFHDTPFRYTWPRYIPENTSTFDFFWSFRTALAEKLRESATVESEDGQLRTPTTVRYVPKQFRDESNMHLILSETTKSTYLSHKYSESDRKRLKNIGVTTLSEKEFLHDLKESLAARNVSMSEEWHSNVAKALLPLISNFEREIFDLPLILLGDGRRVTASSGTVFFPGDRIDHAVPPGIEVFEVQRDIQNDPNCERLYTNLRVKPFSVPAVQALILKKHSNKLSEPEPSRSELLLQALFLFRSEWRKQSSEVQFWVTTRTGTLRRSREVYVDTDENYSASRYLERNTEKFSFLHRSYYKEIASDELPAWITWLHEQLGMWKVPRLVKDSRNNLDPELSEDFLYILQKHPSRQFLVLLKENWSIYSQDTPQISQNQLTTLRAQLASVPVTCRDGKQHVLETTSTGYSLPEDFRSEYSFLQPVLDIPNPQDHKWTFLKMFGVTVNDDLNTYLGILNNIQGREVSVEFVHWLYDGIQGRIEDNPTLVRELFMQNDYVYIPCSSTNDPPRWVAVSDCVWTGPKCLTQSLELSNIHPDHRILFVKYLNVQDAGLETLISEARAITSSALLSRITDIFKELNKILPDSISTEATNAIRSLLALKIFPLDEGGDSDAGFDELSSGTTESEWYIADRPHLRQCFQGVVSLLALTVEDVQATRRLIGTLNLQNRLLSEAAKESRKIHGGRARGKETDMVYRGKTKFFDRLMPESIPRRQEILFQLENMEIWHADKILLGWSVETIGPTSGGAPQESLFDDDGLQALVMLPTEAQALRIYLRDEHNSSCLPLELAEQLAAFCQVPEHVVLIYFILSQENSSRIEDALDRRGFPKTREMKSRVANATPCSATPEGNKEGEDGTSERSSASAEGPQVSKAPGRNYAKIWIGGDDEQREDEEPQLNIVSDDEEAKSDIDQHKSPGEGLLALKSTDNQATESRHTGPAASTKLTANGEHTVPQSNTANPTPPKESTSRRPNYIALDDAPRMREYVQTRGQHSRRKRKPLIAADSRGIEKFERPRIVSSTIVFVPNSQELPSENFSNRAPEGMILPGRAQISQSGDCTIFLAVEPANKIDTYTEFLGELYVSKLLEKYLGRKYDPYAQWTSQYRHLAGYSPFETEKRSMATFTLYDGSAMTEFLIQSGSGWRWNGNYPLYHILVKTTNGGQESPFTMSTEEMEMIRTHRVPEDKRPSQVLILVRVFDMRSTASASFFVDPWSMYASGGMQIDAQNDSYTAKIRLASPHLLFNNFEIGEVSVTRSFRDTFHFFTSYLRDSGELWTRIMLQSDERKYTYKPLQKGSFIRLLRLYPGNGQEELKGELKRVSLESAKSKNPFVALSYAWGNGLKPFVLDIGGTRTIRITASLYFALKRLREEKRSILVWADAICIDQNNDHEKGHQVRLMSTIYKSALRVCAWLGNEADQSNSAIDCLCAIKRASQSSNQAATVPLPSAENPVWDAINKFFERDWFRRVWIVQELVLAPHIILLCGSRKFQWDDIYIPATLCSVEAEKSNAALMKSVSQTMAPVLSLGRLRSVCHGKDNNTAQRGLLTLFKDFEHTRSSRRRDKLFAFLGLACDADDSGFDPDYVAPLEAVVRKYAGVFVQRAKGMELLYHAGITDLESATRFPSWVPNWVTTTYPRTITTWKSKSGRFTAGSHLEDDIKVSPQNDAILTATAYIVDRIAQVGQTSFAASDRIIYLKEVFSVIESIRTYPTKDNLKDLVWKVPIGDALHPPSGSWNEVDFCVSYQALAEYLQLGDETTDWNAEFSKIRAVAKMKQFLFRPQELRRFLWPYLFTAQEFAERFVDAKVCITKKGYVGIVPGAARVGSLVAVFYGSAVPFVIDENEYFRRCYRHIGECYIHGIMHGTENRDSGLFQSLPVKVVHLC